jgi:hypothetical protein
MYPMKNLKSGIICLLFILACAVAEAQSDLVREPDNNRPSLFHQLPQRLNCRLPNLQTLLELQPGQQVNINIADNLNFQGVVASVANKEGGRINSVVIRSTNFKGAALSFSKVIKEDGSIQYAGRIISFQHGDAYEIQFENGQYVFLKKGFYDLVNE